jgi:copper oxidase (laccase) domain-containing protein
MQLLCFSNTHNLALPLAFENTFALTTRVLFANNEPLSESFLQSRFSLAEDTFHVRLLLDKMLPDACELEQIHSATMVEESAAAPGSRGDGIFAVRGNEQVVRALGIRTADCLAVAFAATLGGLRYGAIVHAGWRGFVQGIHVKAIEQLVNSAEAHGQTRQSLLTSLEVFVAPAIFGASYACGADVAEALAQHRGLLESRASRVQGLSSAIRACSNVAAAGVRASGIPGYEEGKVYPDLQLLMACDCLALGVLPQRITVLRENTWGSPLLFSYRHSTLRGGTEGRRLHTHLVFRGVA